MKETTMMTTMSGMMDAEQRMTSLTIAQVTGKPSETWSQHGKRNVGANLR